MAKHNTVDNPYLETPNTTGTELQAQVKANNQNYVQPNQVQGTTNPTQPTKKTESAWKPAQNTTQNTTQNVQTVQNVQPSQSVVVRMPSDFTDDTVRGYMNEYQNGVSINDYQAQINALTALDQYRVENGYEPIYTSTIFDLNNKRNAKMETNIKDYDNRIAQAYNSGDYELAQQLGQELLDYKAMTGYKDNYKRYDPRDVADYVINNEYRSNYDSIINGIVSELLTARFTYNPAEDEALLKAQEYAVNTAYESMNARGILNSSMTAQIVTKTIASLQPTYEKMARDEFYDNLNRLQSMASYIIDLDDRQYKRWQDNTQRNLQWFQILKDEVDVQWDKVNKMGYVDNWASVVLGVAPGTLSPATRQMIQEQQAKVDAETNKLMTDLALAQAKAELDLDTYATKQAISSQYDLDSYATKQAISSQYDLSNYSAKQAISSQYDVSTYAAKKAIDSQYGTGSTKDLTFNGSLNATALKGQLERMAQNIDADTEDGAKKLIDYAYKNAKTHSDFVQAISGGDYYDGWTESEALNILNKEQPKATQTNPLFTRPEESWEGFVVAAKPADYDAVLTEAIGYINTPYAVHPRRCRRLCPHGDGLQML